VLLDVLDLWTEHVVGCSLCIDSAVDVVVDLNHTDIPDVHVYVDHDLVSPDSDRLHLPVVSDASRTAGLYVMASCQAIKSVAMKSVYECRCD